MDRISKERRSWNMSRIQGGDTQPEKAVRSLLHRLGYRFRLRPRTLPGKPDIVLRKWNTVIFVHGCFWHRHRDCKYAYHPCSRRRFWSCKFRQNVERDKRTETILRDAGWRVLVVWECELRDPSALVKRLVKQLNKSLGAETSNR